MLVYSAPPLDNFEFLERAEIPGGESVNALDTVRQHGGDDLQIEDITAVTGRLPKSLIISFTAAAVVGNT